ncbi:ABC transporter permease [Synechococcus sp. CS-1328]|uniref:ABC transporter permease n=1 Tax=Synechococcus sp. CS-1328 TaxID=2847976 RepID=UPI00223ABCF4|nr:ABC transporter permease [Synechococcus sp. CS-1328]MCT0225273.1 ABC transporter permease [Synechococcus sp. CS-1328]
MPRQRSCFGGHGILVRPQAIGDRMLVRIRQELAEAAPLAVLVGASLGYGLTTMVSSALGQNSNLSLQALMIGTLQIFGPVGVNLIWISRSAPLRVGLAARHRWHQMQRGEPPDAGGPRLWRELAAAAITAMLLLPYFVGSVLLAGVVATPRIDAAGQLSELVGQISPADLVQTLLRTALFAVAAEALCLRKGRRLQSSLEELPRLIADAIPECFLMVIALEAAWITLIDPIHGIVR